MMMYLRTWAVPFLLATCLFLLTPQSVVAEIPEHLVEHLSTYAGDKLPLMYSGYISVDDAKGQFFHYWLVKATVDPSTAPLILWMNGGPGCSSMEGLFYEHGPFKFASPTSENLTLVDNPYSWHKLASILYVEAPLGVGFSFSKDPLDYETNDEITADMNYKFVKKFFESHSEYSRSAFYVSGESYAGIYVPMLADRVLDGVNRGELNINFRGTLTGNGITHSPADDFLTAYLPFLYGHSLISKAMYTETNEKCLVDPLSSGCSDAMARVYDAMEGVNIYNIYGDCVRGPISHKIAPLSSTMKGLYEHMNKKQKLNIIPPCIDSYQAETLLNDPQFRKEANVEACPNVWHICTDLIRYRQTSGSMVPVYKRLLEAGKRVLIFAGDADFAVPLAGSEHWITNMANLTETESWQQWHYNDKVYGKQVGGYKSEYKEGLTFMSVRGAGHMVPETNPAAAYAMLLSFLRTS